MTTEPGERGRFLAAVQRLRADYERDIAALTERVETLQTALGTVQRGQQSDSPRPVDWPALQRADPAECDRLWMEMGAWVGGLLVPRYWKIAEKLHDCWPRHPDVVDVMTATWTAWRGAYGPQARPTDAVNWHRDARPLLERYLDGAFPGISGCTDHGTKRPPPA